LSDLPDSNSRYLLIRFSFGRDAKSARASYLVRDGNAAGHDVITKDVIARSVTAFDAVVLGEIVTAESSQSSSKFSFRVSRDILSANRRRERRSSALSN
jgi:hypothetical protein